MKVLNEKYLLKRCAEGLVPPSVQARPKQPYRAPEGKSFFDGVRYDYVEELLGPERIQRDGIFCASAVHALTRKFKTRNAIGIKDNMALVGILSTQILFDRFCLHSTQEDSTPLQALNPNLQIDRPKPANPLQGVRASKQHRNNNSSIWMSDRSKS